MVKETKDKENSRSIKVTLAYLTRLVASRQLISEIRSKGIPDKLGYWLAKATNYAESENKSYLEQRREIVKRHAKLKGDDIMLYDKTNEEAGHKKGDIVWISETHRSAATKEIDDLLRTEVEIPMKPIKISEYMKDEESLGLSLHDWDLIFPLLEDIE